MIDLENKNNLVTQVGKFIEFDEPKAPENKGQSSSRRSKFSDRADLPRNEREHHNSSRSRHGKISSSQKTSYSKADNIASSN